ncbi:hypothetical protein PoB_003396000 [Plakobranchus ocellatus]|uniref:Uncharacterized protein n=1 Tax=Plakobranchus ocellatus TaxID=259542 RepID=A0AAV4AKR4_9GAST|nr:hypothetical protein PoB_003396000 [Plakobranchus ocellatus]
MSILTAHAPHNLRGHAFQMERDKHIEHSAVFGSSSSGTAFHPPHPLLHPVPIPLHHYMPQQQHPHYYIPNKPVILPTSSGYIPPVSPPVADAVPPTMALPSSSSAASDTAHVGATKCPYKHVYDNIRNPYMLNHPYHNLATHVRRREEDQLLPLLSTTMKDANLTPWASLYNIDLASSAALYYRGMAASESHLLAAPVHHVGVSQKDRLSYGYVPFGISALLPTVPCGISLSQDDFRRSRSGVIISEMPSSPAPVSLSQSRPSSLEILPKTSTPSRSLSTSTFSASSSSSSCSPTSSLSKRADALTLSSPSCTSTTPTPNLVHQFPARPTRHCPVTPASPPTSPGTVHRPRHRWAPSSPGLPRQASHGDSERKAFSRMRQNRLASDTFPSGRSLATSVTEMTNIHLPNKSDLDSPSDTPPTRPPLASSLSMPSGSNFQHILNPYSAYRDEDVLHKFHSFRGDDPALMDARSEDVLENYRASRSGLPSLTNHPQSPSSGLSSTPQGCSPLDFRRPSLLGKTMAGTQVEMDRFEPRHRGGSIVTGVPATRIDRFYSCCSENCHEFDDVESSFVVKVHHHRRGSYCRSSSPSSSWLVLPFFITIIVLARIAVLHHHHRRGSYCRSSPPSSSWLVLPFFITIIVVAFIAILHHHHRRGS